MSRHTQTLFKQTASTTIANSAAETTLLTTGIGSLILPADFFLLGKSLQIRIGGYHSSTGNPTVRIKVKLGQTIILDTGAVTSGNGTANAFLIDAYIICRTTGVSGTVAGYGTYQELHNTGSVLGMNTTDPVTVNTTTSQTVDVTVTWGTADPGNTITSGNASIVLE